MMARVPYDPIPQVNPAGPVGDYENIQASPADFGGLSAQATERLGASVGQDAGQIAQAAVQRQHFLNQVGVDDGFNKLQQGFYNTLYGDKGLYSLRGKAAGDAAGPTKQALDSLRDSISASLPNTVSRLQFDVASRRLMQFTLSDMGRFVDRENNTYALAVNKATEDVNMQGIAAAYNNDTTYNNNLAEAKSGAVKAVEVHFGKGADPVLITDETNRITTRAIATRVEAWSNADPVAASRWLQTQRGNLDPNTFRMLQDRLKPTLRNMQGDADIHTLAAGGIPMTSGSGQAEGVAGLGPASGNVRKAAVAGGVDPVAAITVAQLESKSGGVPDRPRSQYKGIFQLGDEEFTQNGGVSRGNVDDEASAGVANLKRLQPIADEAVGGKASPWQVYLFHQQGPAGAKALFQADPSSNVVDALAPAYGGDRRKAEAAIYSNFGDPDGTVGAFLSAWAQKYAATEQNVRQALGSSASPDAGGAQQVSASEATPASTEPASSSAGSGMPAGFQMPDWSKLEQRALDMTEGDDERRATLLSKLNQLRSRTELATATTRATLEKTQGDLVNAALRGLPITVPIDQIKQAFPPEEANRRITEIGVAQGAGQILDGIKWGSPAQVEQVMNDLTTGLGTVSDTIRAHLVGSSKELGTVTTPQGPGQPASTVETPEAFGMRTRIATMALQQIQARAKVLYDDPAGYVAAEPTVAASAKAMDPNNPDTYENFARTSLAVQQHLGVASGVQHVLTSTQAQSMAAQLTAPGVDVHGQLNALKSQWGEAWPHVFGDLVTLGKLPGAYQGVAVLDDPKDAALLARAINETSKGGRDWSDILGTDGRKSIAQTIRDDVRNNPDITQRLEQSLKNSGASAQQIDGALVAIETLAYGKKFYNQDDSAAVNAVNAFTSKYTFLPNGQARVPVAIADTVTSNAGAILHGLTLDKISVPNDFRATDSPADLKAKPTAPAAADYLLSVQTNPTWVTAPKGDALWLLDNQARLVRDRQGNPISVPFSAARIMPSDSGGGFEGAPGL